LTGRVGTHLVTPFPQAASLGAGARNGGVGPQPQFCTTISSCF
jgi:hypothetical protein